MENKKTIQINNLRELINYLENDLLTPSQAISIVCKALNMIELKNDNEPIFKDYVLMQLKLLLKLTKGKNEIPIFFLSQQDPDFSFNDF